MAINSVNMTDPADAEPHMNTPISSSKPAQTTPLADDTTKVSWDGSGSDAIPTEFGVVERDGDSSVKNVFKDGERGDTVSRVEDEKVSGKSTVWK